MNYIGYDIIIVIQKSHFGDYLNHNKLEIISMRGGGGPLTTMLMGSIFRHDFLFFLFQQLLQCLGHFQSTYFNQELFGVPKTFCIKPLSGSKLFKNPLGFVYEGGDQVPDI